MRLPVSKIAAVVGLHPFADLAELAMEFIYQDDWQLLQQDAQNLSLTVISRDEERRLLAAKAGPAAAVAIDKAVAAAVLGVPSIKAASSLKTQTAAALEAAVTAKRLTSSEAETLQSELRRGVDTGFGTSHEDEALNVYQAQVGWEVKERNERFVSWDIPLDEGQPPHPTRREGSATSGAVKDGYGQDLDLAAAIEISLHTAHQGERAVVGSGAAVGSDGGSGADGGGEGESSLKRSCQRSESPEVIDLACSDNEGDLSALHFTIIGTVDGVCEQLDTSAPEPDDWQLVHRIVEVKHRMSRHAVHLPPPLHDQLQLALYELMHGVGVGDLVHVFRDECHDTTAVRAKPARVFHRVGAQYQ